MGRERSEENGDASGSLLESRNAQCKQEQPPGSSSGMWMIQARQKRRLVPTHRQKQWSCKEIEVGETVRNWVQCTEKWGCCRLRGRLFTREVCLHLRDCRVADDWKEQNWYEAWANFDAWKGNVFDYYGYRYVGDWSSSYCGNGKPPVVCGLWIEFTRLPQHLPSEAGSHGMSWDELQDELRAIRRVRRTRRYEPRTPVATLKFSPQDDYGDRGPLQQVQYLLQADETDDEISSNEYEEYSDDGTVEAECGGDGSETNDPEEHLLFPSHNMDWETAAILRRLSKKDTTTKLKALNALSNSFQELSPADASALLPCWVFHYRKLVYDSSWQIRKATHKAMLNLATRIGSSLEPHLKSLMGPWWVSHFDPLKEVSKAAKQSFQASFADPKSRLEAIIFWASEIVSYIQQNLMLTPQTIFHKNATIDESTERYERVVAASLLALPALLDVIPPPSSVQHEKLSAFELAALDIFQSPKLFQAYFKSTSAGIRSAVYQSMQAYIRFAPDVISRNLESVTKLVLGALSEKDPDCHQPMWDMVFLFSRNHERAWEGPTVRKTIFPRLFSLLRHGRYGSRRLLYSSILPLLALIPTSVFSPAEDFFVKFFRSLWHACEEGFWSPDDGELLLGTVKECLFWVLKNSGRYCADDPERLQLSIVKIVCKLLFRTYTATDSSARLLNPSLLLSSTKFMEQVGFSMINILGSLEEHLRAAFLTSFVEECSRTLQDGRESPLERMAHFLVLLNDGRMDPLNSVVGSIVSKELISLQQSEQPGAVKRLYGLVSACGPATFATLASGKWAGMADKRPQETDSTFSLKYLHFFFREVIIPCCLRGKMKELKLNVLLSFLEDVTLNPSIWNALIGLETEGAHGLIRSTNAAMQLLEKLLNILASSSDISTNSRTKTLLSTVISAPTCASAVTFDAAREAIDVVLWSYPMIRVFPECSKTLAKVFATMVCLHWAYVDCAKPEADVEPDGEAEFVKSLFIAYQKLPAICSNLSSTCWWEMQTLLVKAVESTDPELGANRAIDLLNLVKFVRLDSQQLQDLLLANH